jgi:hypothetical protein
VRFIDRPPTDTRTGIWGVPVAQPGASPRFVTERLEESLSARGFLVETKDDVTTIERLADGQRWTVPARGRSVLISPGATRIAWTEVNDELPPDQQVVSFWVANLDGTDARRVATLRRGGLSGWISDDVLLLTGRESAGAPEQVLWRQPIDGSPRVELARAERLRSPSLSPSGAWAAFYVTFDADPGRNGLWLARTDGSDRRKLPAELFGSYQWRGCSRECDPAAESLLVVPLRPEARLHELWQVEPATGDARPLTDPEITPFKIANGDWRASPDGRYITYVESSDRNIWVLELPQ